MTDSLARARAILGVAPGCSARELKRRYITLVKRWHPDQFADDPAGVAEANDRLRHINQAFARVAAASPPVARRPEPATSGVHAQPPNSAEPTAPEQPKRPLTRAEIDAIIRLMEVESPVTGAFRFASWFTPIAAAVFVSVGPRGSWPLAVGLLVLGLYAFVSGRRSRPRRG